MKATLIGVRRVDFTDQQSNRKISGYSLYLTYAAEGVQGVEATKQFVSDEFCASLQVSPPALVGKSLNVDFNTRGKLAAISHDR